MPRHKWYKWANRSGELENKRCTRTAAAEYNEKYANYTGWNRHWEKLTSSTSGQKEIGQNDGVFNDLKVRGLTITNVQSNSLAKTTVRGRNIDEDNLSSDDGEIVF